MRPICRGVVTLELNRSLRNKAQSWNAMKSFTKGRPVILIYGDLRFHLTLRPTAINDEIARGVYARPGLAEKVDQVVGLVGRILID